MVFQVEHAKLISKGINMIVFLSNIISRKDVNRLLSDPVSLCTVLYFHICISLNKICIKQTND